MTVFFNWPDQTSSALANPSREAGAAVGQALAAVMGILQAFETRRESGFFENVSIARHQLMIANNIFSDLHASAPPIQVPFSIRLRGAWAAADGFVATMGGVLNRDFIRPLGSLELSARDLMGLAAALTSRLDQALGDLKPNLDNATAGRKIAADAVALQMFGILVAELLAERRATTVT